MAWASIVAMPASLSSSRGLTLIELLMFIMVVGIALAAMLRVFAQATQASADPMIRRQQLAIAESMLREIQLMPFTWCDPDDVANVETATSASDCAQPELSGPESGETRYGPLNFFDNVKDYSAFTMSGIKDISKVQVPGLTGYSLSISAVSGQLDSITSTSADAAKLTVTVTGPDGSTLSLQGWRTRYAPNAPF